VEEGRYYLEDSTAQVPLDLSEAMVLTDGIITENCIVLVEGEMVDGILHVHRMGNPIVETRNEARDTIGLQNSDLFHSISTIAELDKLREQEEEHGPDGMFVVTSDVHLDKPIVMEKLETLLDGFKDMDPLPVFVFMGNFCSVPMASPKMMIGYFEELANVIVKFPRIAREGKFVFVPGPNDPGVADILPRPPLPKYVTSALRSKLSHAHFATNPCRMRYFSKELVFSRQDIVHKLRRQCILKPRSGGAWEQHTVKTILDQGHLCPLPLVSCPIYWQFDHALRLYPLPDALVMGDRDDQYYENYAECDVINPGPFSNDFSFVVYRPVASVDEDGQTKSDVEFSQIGKDVM
jgi:DNA polymerase epsilon subunit 2